MLAINLHKEESYWQIYCHISQRIMDAKNSPLKNLLNKPFSIGSPPYAAFASKVRLQFQFFFFCIVFVYDISMNSSYRIFVFLSINSIWKLANSKYTEPIATTIINTSFTITSTKCSISISCTATTKQYCCTESNAIN